MEKEMLITAVKNDQRNTDVGLTFRLATSKMMEENTEHYDVSYLIHFRDRLWKLEEHREEV
jgi:hypothetical protein